MTKIPSQRCRVLISYSHDSQLHKDQVLAFCAQLRVDGIDAKVDQFFEFPPEGWPRWMHTQLKSVDYVLVVLSKIYKTRFEGHEEPGKGNGATHEGFLITQDIHDSQSKNVKYIPIYFRKSDSRFAPDVLKAVTRYNVARKPEYERLYSVLTSQPMTPTPPLGEVRRLMPKQIDQHIFEPSEVASCDAGIGGVATETASELIELRIKRNFDEFSDADQNKLLEVISQLLNMDGPVRVVSKARGSVLLTLDLTAEQAEKLYWLVEQGELSAFDVTDARIVEPEAAILTAPSTNEERLHVATRIADKMFQQQPDWITFFREVLGTDGLVRKLFTTPEELAEFEKTTEYAEIQAMVAKLREKSGSAGDGKEPTRVITIRLPKSLHESLRAEAHNRKTTMNQLCISKFLQVIDEQMIISE